jgi:hypothetical protein
LIGQRPREKNDEQGADSVARIAKILGASLEAIAQTNTCI